MRCVEAAHSSRMTAPGQQHPEGIEVQERALLVATSPPFGERPCRPASWCRRDRSRHRVKAPAAPARPNPSLNSDPGSPWRKTDRLDLRVTPNQDLAPRGHLPELIASYRHMGKRVTASQVPGRRMRGQPGSRRHGWPAAAPRFGRWEQSSGRLACNQRGSRSGRPSVAGSAAR